MHAITRPCNVPVRADDAPQEHATQYSASWRAVVLRDGNANKT